MNLIFKVTEYFDPSILDTLADELFDIVCQYGFEKTNEKFIFHRSSNKLLSEKIVSDLGTDLQKVRDFKGLVTSAIITTDGLINLQERLDFILGNNDDFEARQVLHNLNREEKVDSYLKPLLVSVYE